MTRKKAPQGAHKRWMKGVLYAPFTDDCVIWPFAKHETGYGLTKVGTSHTTAHRYVCSLAHGAPPPDAQAAHSCNNRACCNPRHLRWATALENSADRIKHGTSGVGSKNHTAKLTEAAVAEIRASEATSAKLARQYGVSHKAVRNARSGVTWAHV